MMSEDCELWKERGDVGGPWALGEQPPFFSSACSVVVIDGLVIMHFARDRDRPLQGRQMDVVVAEEELGAEGTGARLSMELFV